VKENPDVLEASEPSPSPPPVWRMSACLDLLAGIQEQIRFADSKAGFIAAFNVLLFGFVANHLDKLRSLCAGRDMGTGVVILALVLVGVYVASMVVTFALIVLCVVSRFGGGGTQGHVFFAHIAARYGEDHQRYAKDVDAMNNAQWLDELGAQAVAISRLAVLKHKYVRWATYCTLFSLLLWVGSLVTMVSIFWLRAAAS
jgi:hypothetical protein